MNVTVDIQSASAEPVPDEDDIRSWIQHALEGAGHQHDTEISLRLVDEDEMAELNHTYRGKRGATNVLSFPADLPPELALPMLGDIAICAPVVIREAREQGKPVGAHWAHMAVHGTLHLLGYDHLEDNEAQEMESLETTVMNTLKLPCPYSGYPSEERTAP